MDEAPRYLPSAAKALEALLWLANAQRGIDIYRAVKAAFFADKHHIQQYGRPIVGDDYKADTYGPLPQVMYGLARHDPIEMLAAGYNGPIPVSIGQGHRLEADREPNMRLLSESDVEALRVGLEHVRGKSFNDLYLETHADPAYRRANGGRMDYRDFIPDDDPAAEKKREHIGESAEYAVF